MLGAYITLIMFKVFTREQAEEFVKENNEEVEWDGCGCCGWFASYHIKGNQVIRKETTVHQGCEDEPYNRVVCIITLGKINLDTLP